MWLFPAGGVDSDHGTEAWPVLAQRLFAEQGSFGVSPLALEF